jgi:hypothetical protein
MKKVINVVYHLKYKIAQIMLHNLMYLLIDFLLFFYIELTKHLLKHFLSFVLKRISFFLFCSYQTHTKLFKQYH